MEFKHDLRDLEIEKKHNERVLTEYWCKLESIILDMARNGVRLDMSRVPGIGGKPINRYVFSKRGKLSGHLYCLNQLIDDSVIDRLEK